MYTDINLNIIEFTEYIGSSYEKILPLQLNTVVANESKIYYSIANEALMDKIKDFAKKVWEFIKFIFKKIKNIIFTVYNKIISILQKVKNKKSKNKLAKESIDDTLPQKGAGHYNGEPWIISPDWTDELHEVFDFYKNTRKNINEYISNVKYAITHASARNIKSEIKNTSRGMVLMSDIKNDFDKLLVTYDAVNITGPESFYDARNGNVLEPSKAKQMMDEMQKDINSIERELEPYVHKLEDQKSFFGGPQKAAKMLRDLSSYVAKGYTLITKIAYSRVILFWNLYTKEFNTAEEAKEYAKERIDSYNEYMKKIKEDFFAGNADSHINE